MEKSSLSWPIWKTITMGGITKKKLIERVRSKISIGDDAIEKLTLSSFRTVKKHQKFFLARLKLKDLGFIKKPIGIEIFIKATRLGLYPCPMETPLHLASISNKLNGDCYVMTKSLREHGMFEIFWINPVGFPDSDSWVESSGEASEHRWDLNYEFVFCINLQ